MRTPTVAEVKQWIVEKIDCQKIEVCGEGQSFEVLVISESFEGRSVIERHQLVYRALGEHMISDIHALSLRTISPKEYRVLEESND